MLTILKITIGFLCLVVFGDGMWIITFLCVQLTMNKREHIRLLFWMFGDGCDLGPSSQQNFQSRVIMAIWQSSNKNKLQQQIQGHNLVMGVILAKFDKLLMY